MMTIRNVLGTKSIMWKLNVADNYLDILQQNTEVKVHLCKSEIGMIKI